VTEPGDKPDFLALVIGPQGFGKSSLGAELAEQRLAAGSWLIVQDSNRETGRFCREYASTADFLTALDSARGAEQAAPAGAAFAGGADEVLGLAVTLGERWNRPTGRAPHPICVLVNETTSFDQAGSTHIGKEITRALNQRRHLGLELVLCMQDPAHLPSAVFTAATEVHMFRQDRADSIDKLERGLGLARGALRGLGALEQFEYVTWRRVVGLV
jgi:hypothetical protein